MKAQKITYWVSTVVFCSWMLLNAYFYLTFEEAKQLCRHFGFPDYFRMELAVAKIAGVVVLLLAVAKGRIKEWAYFGFAITVLSGFIAHVCSGDGVQASWSALMALAILATSYFTYNSIKT